MTCLVILTAAMDARNSYARKRNPHNDVAMLLMLGLDDGCLGWCSKNALDEAMAVLLPEVESPMLPMSWRMVAS
jgi:hypothetical protein